MAPDQDKFDAVVCGAGIAGIAAAQALSAAGLKRIALLESGAPLSLTSDKSTECYRNWWPGPGDAMVALMNRSITLMEAHARASGNVFQMNRRGYLFATARREMVDVFEAQALEAQDLGAGPLRRVGAPGDYQPATPDGFESPLDGADLIVDEALIREQFPYLNPQTVAVLHARRCGALSAQQLGMYLLERARDSGVELITGEYVGAETSNGSVTGVTAVVDGCERELRTDTLVLSPGPYLNKTLAQIGVSLPVLVEKHIKISMPDHLGAVPRNAPLIIWADPIKLQWSDEERAAFAEQDETRYLLDEFPAGVHGRPVGAGDQMLMYWTYDCPTSVHPEFPLTWDPNLPEITLRGMAEMVPGLGAYFDPMPRPYVDGGYYTKTTENRPLIGPLAVPGAFVCSAFSGFGIMASCGSGELLAQHVTGAALPHYAPAFLPGRYEDPAYRKLLETWDASGQL
jgi:glycine/D-amino acid oxidase-like deaminating enzyme